MAALWLEDSICKNHRVYHRCWCAFMDASGSEVRVGVRVVRGVERISPATPNARFGL